MTEYKRLSKVAPTILHRTPMNTRQQPYGVHLNHPHNGRKSNSVSAYLHQACSSGWLPPLPLPRGIGHRPKKGLRA